MRRQGAPERFLATVLFVDIVGSTEVATRLGDRAWRDLLAEFYALARRELRRTGGRELDTAGDGLFAAFEAPGQALTCATAILARVPELDIQVRTGIHVGEVERVASKVGGIAVHIGARVAGRAAPDEILVTTTVRELAAGSGVRFEDRGEHELKGLPETWRLHAVIPAVGTEDRAGLARPEVAAVRPMRRRRRFWSRHPRLTAAGAGVAALALMGGAYLLVSTPPALPALEPNSVGLLDPARGAVIGQIQVGSLPAAIAFGEGSLWVANAGAGTVSRIDPERLTTIDTIQLGGTPEGIAFGFGAVWVANSGTGTVSQINPGPNTVVRSIGVGNGPVDLAVGGDSLWVVNSIDATVSRVDPDAGEEAALIPLGGAPGAIAADDESIWVTNRDGGAVTRLDPATGAAEDAINVGSGPEALAIGFGSVWVANRGDSTVSRVDAEARRVVATVVVPGQPSGVAVSTEAVWVASSLDGTITRIDPGSNTTRVIAAGSAPERLVATSDGRVWFSARATTASHRGGTLRITISELEGFTVDPAVAYSAEEWDMILAAHDGLVGYRRVPGAGGSALVANLAESIPRPTDGGLTYTFRVRDEIRYSDGRLVAPADFRNAIERGFEVPDSPEETAVPTFYGGILGADRCAEAIGPGGDCDLSEGIEVDDGARTVSFHLVEPDPEFLFKLAMPFAAAVPADVPGEPLAAPLPATGPYMIVEQSDARLRLTRNPEFRVWSPEGRPDGFADEIVWSIGGDIDGAVDRVVAGEADLLADRHPPPERMQELAARFPSQVHVRPSGTVFVFLDTTKPPFDDVLVRQAVNYAVDRGRIVELAGGRLQASPTCQVIQPNFYGYRRICPFTSEPGPAGVWNGPDRSRALELMEEAGAVGSDVQLWSFEPYPGIGEHLETVLRDLGLNPTLTTVSQEEFFEEVFAPDSEVMAGPLAWFPDYPTASTFIQVNFGCGEPVNFSRFCDPALDARMGEARALQAADPVAAAEIWADLDRSITDAAAWVPLVTPNDTFFVSERVGNVQLHQQWGILLDQLWVE